jgi:hypothetical protein
MSNNISSTTNNITSSSSLSSCLNGEQKSEGVFSWLSSFIWDTKQSAFSTTPPTISSIPMIPMTDPVLPPLPFKYNPNTRHILLFNGNFTDESGSPQYNHGFSIVSCTDLDYEFFKYFGSEEMKGAFIYVPQSDNNLDELIEQFPVEVDQFLTHIKTVSSDQPQYEAINDFLEFDSLYQYFGGDRFLDWWIEGLTSKNSQQNVKIQELKKAVNIHGKKYYPDYF